VGEEVCEEIVLLLIIMHLEVFDLMEDVTDLKAIMLAHSGIPGSAIT
jgi:hypothetical protein